jgi:hypothetical protein
MTEQIETAVRQPRRWLWAAGLAAGAIGGVAAGYGLGVANQPEPEIVTETVTEVETVIETVEAVPDACLDALGYGIDAVNMLSGRASVGYATDADEAREQFTEHGVACYEAAGVGGMFVDEGEPEPEGQVTGRCDSLLGDSGSSDRYVFEATINAENTGNVGIVVEVWVEFEQIGAEPVRYTEKVEVLAGETVTVHVNERVTRDQWRRYADGGWNCDMGGDIVESL